MQVNYGASSALKGISLEVKDGEIVTLLGANGAGKTTLLRTISGLLKPKKGTIEFNGALISGLTPDIIVRQGISHVPEGRRIFTKLTVLENLEMGAFSRNNKQELEEDLEKVFKLFPRLKERIYQRGGTFSGGEQQMLAIARALMARPKYILFDEPSMGLAPIVVDEIFDKIVQLNKEEKLTVLLVEQNAAMALSIAHRGYVLETGRIVLEGESAALMNNEEVKKAYLGIA